MFKKKKEIAPIRFPSEIIICVADASLEYVGGGVRKAGGGLRSLAYRQRAGGRLARLSEAVVTFALKMRKVMF